MKERTRTKQELLAEIKELRASLEEAQKDRMLSKGDFSIEKAVDEAREYAKGIVETIRESLLVLSPDLKIILANPTFYKTFNVTPEDTVGQYLFDLGNRQWDIPRLRELLEDILPKNTKFENFEVDHEFQTIGRKIVLLNARRIYREGETTQTILLAIEDITYHKQTDNALKESENRLRFLATELLSAQEKERKRIASELHDSLGATLGAINFKVGDVRQKGRKGEAVEEDLETLAKMVEESVQDVRRIQMDLRPPMLDDLGILPTLSWFCRRFKTTYPNIHVEYQFDIQENMVPGTLRAVIYRIIQEAFNNVAKHTTATLVNLTLGKVDATIELTIQDNGQGFDGEAVLSRESSRRGLGLSSMRERAELSGGSFYLESAIGKGTVIRVSWPIE